MNAKPCLPVIVSGARLTVSARPHQRAWRTGFREATTAQVSAALDVVESGSHRDSPAAIRSSAGVDRPDAGEGKRTLWRCGRKGRRVRRTRASKSPMSAAEMDRRIGLMGRLNDARGAAPAATGVNGAGGCGP